MKFKIILVLNVLSLGIIVFALGWWGSKAWRVIQANFWRPTQLQQLAATPPMGWNGWNHFRCSPELNETSFKEMTDVMVSSGMKEVGYTYVNLDDCWQVARRADGQIVVDEERFPSGIKALADYVHAKGLKFGIYTSGGRITCEGRPGSYGHELQDAKTYAEWGVDYIKVDWCGIDYLDTFKQYTLWREAIEETGRPMVLSVAIAAIDKIENNKVWLWGGETGQLWRTAIDIQDYWPDMLRVFDRNSRYSEYTRPGAWNDADMLHVGNGHMTDEEYKTHFSLWAMMASPLLAGNDLRSMSLEIRNILTHPEVIAINQDSLGRAATLIKRSEDVEIWSKVLTPMGGRRAVLFLNRSDSDAEAEVSWGELDLLRWAWVSDVWGQQNLGFIDSGFRAQVPPHGVVLLQITGLNRFPVWQVPLLPKTVRTGYLTAQADSTIPALPPTEPAVVDPAANSIAILAGSDIGYNLSGRCQVFEGDAAVDTQNSDPEVNIIFKVYGDGQLLFQTQPHTASSAAEKVRLNVSRYRVLNLVTESTFARFPFKQVGVWSRPFIECDE